ncbi:MAG: glycoside hydrolase family 127 protein [Bacteroidetes bacterium]|nr:glycoside hydrolase family 127 protein [Bacteroidota bacterium]MBU1115209.1 glycoside hydrolase family 127 protein [Bacteroidota bacterium]MBU1797228.1 glycoside hydrolase family 127 protein [Bacteroidota bacterium]
MKRIILFLMVLSSLKYAQVPSKFSDYPILAVGIKNVIINDNFWLPKIQLVQDTTIYYAFGKCDTEGRIDNFLVAGGKKEGACQGQMPFDDTDVYKIIEGASYSLISKPNPSLDAYLDSVISIIKIGQEPDGYITTWFTIDRENPPASWVEPSKTRWENEVSSHELYNSGHLFEAASAHYWATGKKNFLDIATKNADLLVENFGPNKLMTPPGHQIVETGLIKLYQITKNSKYLELAKFFLDMRGDSTLHKSSGEYSQDHIPVIEQNEAVGHAVRALYMYAGMTDIAVMYNNKDYLNAVNKIWENVVSKKMYITGGLGSKHSGEAFGDNYELPNLTAYNETCAAIGSVYWNQRLFLLTGYSKYYDIIERTLYNGLISGISTDGKNFFYPNPLEADGEYKFNSGSCTRKPWFNCSCCPTNLIRFLPSIPGLVYATNHDSLFVNLFISNKAQTLIDGEKIEVTQQTDYPWNGHINFSINPEKEKKFTLKLRIPGWAENIAVPGNLYSYLNSNNGKVTLSVNGKGEKIIMNNGYAEISREWNKGDKVELLLPMSIHKVTATEEVKDDSNKVAFEYGPIVYCAEEIDNKQISEISIPNNIDVKTEGKTVISNKVIAIKGKINDEEFTLIPYYLWSNRGVGKMKVWFPREN